MSAPAHGEDEPVVISQKDRVFSPNQVSIPAGQSLLFINDDTTPHHVMVRGENRELLFSSALMQPGEELSYTFEEIGRFTVQCAVHPLMRLEVTVTGPAGSEKTEDVAETGDRS
jgi:cytochrome c peroxidase